MRDNIVFAEDFKDKEEEVFAKIESVGLIDLNRLDKKLADCFIKKVEYIVDHHADHFHYLDSIKEKRILKCGSATTLIVEKILKESDIF